eukprot:tig00020902_g15044.t1
MFLKVLERLEKDHDANLVQHALSFLHLSRNGLVEDEILELLARPDMNELQLPRALWARLFRSLEFYLRPPGDSGEGTVAFYFSQLSDAVQERYLSKPEKHADMHRKMAIYFLSNVGF